MPQLYIRTITNRKQAYNYENDDLVSTIKEAIEHKEGLSQHQFRLIFSGRQLVETSKISETGIKPGDTVHMVMVLRGGADC
jgi:ubiquitin-like protein Nedd8